MASRDQFFKNLPQHLWVNGNFHIQRRAFRYSEVKTKEEIVQYRIKCLVRNNDLLVLVITIFIE